MADIGCDCCVMEVSSQGLMMHRTAGFLFEIGIFTNIEPDHIGPNEHESFADYLFCKSLLFQQCRLGILNADDAHYKDILKNHTCQVETYGFSKEADLYAEDMQLVHKLGYLGVSYHVSGKLDFDVEIDVPGRFSVYNSLAAIAICRHFDVEINIMKKALKQAKTKGRIEMIKVSDEFTLMIDYAHNAMSLKSLLSTLREYEPGRLVCLFGCGGNRDAAKRPKMAEAAAKYADRRLLTISKQEFTKQRVSISKS